MTAPLAPRPARRPTVHSCPKCHRAVAVNVAADAWCLSCGVKMRPLPPRGGRTDNSEGTA